jgi:hypothetical protein
MSYFRDYGDYGRPVKLFEGYLQWRDTDEAEELRESGSSSDFATYMSDKATKRLMWSYNEQPANWRRYTRIYSVSDFKPIHFVRLTEMQDLLEFHEGGEYKDSEIAEIVGPSLTVKTFGRLFSLTRKAIINDDLNQLRDGPAAMGRAAARTLNRHVVSQLEVNSGAGPTAYDGKNLFHTDHSNLLTSALSETSLAEAITKLRTQTDPNGLRIALRPSVLVIPPGLEFTIRKILNSDQIPQPGTGVGNLNVVRNIVDYVVEDYLTDSNDWYLFANPEEAPGIGVGFLNGKDTPDIMLRDPGMRLVLGGSDPYTMEFDTIYWKIRHDWGTGVFDWRGIVKSQVVGA